MTPSTKFAPGKSRRIEREGYEPVLKKSRWLLLKRRQNLASEQRFRLRDLLRYNLKTVRAYLLKEAFQQLWEYNSPAWAGKANVYHPGNMTESLLSYGILIPHRF